MRSRSFCAGVRQSSLGWEFPLKRAYRASGSSPRATGAKGVCITAIVTSEARRHYPASFQRRRSRARLLRNDKLVAKCHNALIDQSAKRFDEPFVGESRRSHSFGQYEEG